MNNIRIKCPRCNSMLEVQEVPAIVATVCSSKTTMMADAHKTSADDFKKMKAEAKIEALRQAGVDTTNLFAICGMGGDKVIGRFSEGKFEVVPDNDPIYKAICKGGTIPDRRLFRRWIMAQVFHMLTVKEYGAKNPMGFTKALQRKGYRYQWEMVVEEMRVQTKLYGKDTENFVEHNRWFNKDVVVSMAKDYIKVLKKVIKKLPIKKCKNLPYIRLYGTNIFTEDVPAKVYAPLTKAVEEIEKASTPENLYKAAYGFFRRVKKTYLMYDFPQSRAFKDAYKGAGAFYTLKNLILFHGCVFPTMNQEASMAYLNYLVQPKDFEGYRLFGVLKEFLTTNHIDIEAKQREWQKINI